MIKLVALKFVHFFITVAQIAFSAFLWLHCLLKDVRASAFGGQNVTLYSVRLDARYLTKIPDHMAIVVGEEAISYNELADMIFWALALGVSFISLYDRKGIILRNESVLRKSLEAKTVEYVGAAKKACCQIDLHTMGSECQGSGYKNGFHNVPLRGHVMLLEEKDGKAWMAAQARQLCRQVADGQLDPDSIDEKFFDRHVKEQTGFPDPSLAVNFGKTPALLGYPPWVTRLTEIISLPSHQNISYRNFFSVLSRYANCDQRLGK